MKYKFFSFITIFILLFLSLPFSISAEEGLWLYFVVDKENNVSLDSFDVWPEEAGGIWNEPIPEAEAFEVRVLDNRGSILNQAYFIPDFLILSDPPVEVDEAMVEVVFPYTQKIRTVQVLKQGQQVLRESIWGRVCNKDGICNNNENYLSCPSDCDQYSQDGFCNSISNDHICDPDCLWDAEAGGECSQPICNDGIKNQDETGIDTGGICLKLQCDNGIWDSGEEGIDCGGVCDWQCGQDACGDGICAEYENRKDCPDCGAPQSVLRNTGTKTLIGYLVMKVEKLVGEDWLGKRIIVQDAFIRTIKPGEEVNLRNKWNIHKYQAQEQGKFRVYAAFLDQAKNVIASDTWEFTVQ